MPRDYPRRLIEVDLPIRRISEHARTEKSLRHGHVSTLHIWWARRPLAACRAIVCASLWPDPVDQGCPASFREVARKSIGDWATNNLGKLSGESYKRFIRFQREPERLNDNLELRGALLDFIADFANWENTTVREYLQTSQILTQAAHEAFGGAPGTRPLVVDPFAGGGSIPLEALRAGADSFASDLNPVAVLLNKVLLEYIPRFGQRLADEVRAWGASIEREVQKELEDIYPTARDGAPVLAYLWARTIKCEGPSCGAEVPVITKTVLAQRKSTNIVLTYRPDVKTKSIKFVIEEQPRSAHIHDGTVKRSSVSCPICGYTTQAENVRQQFVARKGGTADARLLAVVTSKGGQKSYRLPVDADHAAVNRAKERLSSLASGEIPTEPLPYLRSIFNIQLLGVTEWGQLFAPRQALHLATFVRAIRKQLLSARPGDELTVPVATCIGLVLNKMVDFHTSLASWIHQGEKIGHTFGRQALGIIWDYAEGNPFADMSGSWQRCIDYFIEVVEHEKSLPFPGHVEHASATDQVLPDNSAAAFITDPPYYDLVPYADLSDFFYVWLRRTVGDLHRPLFDEPLSPKKLEIVQLAERNPAYAYKTRENFEKLMILALEKNRHVLSVDGIGVVFLAHKGTAAWETQLQAMISAGWTIVASWPLATEREGRLRAMDSAVLASSIQLVCRPRHQSGSDAIGDWRGVLQELPRCIADWMPRLAEEGVVGADAIFACLGPALEIFSRYSRVEKANGDPVTLKEYLEQVWATVEKEALNMIFQGADTAGFEEDARLTAMWLWTLTAGAESGDSGVVDDTEEEEESATQKKRGYLLEYDAARKIAQGLGVHLEDLAGLVEIKGDKARLLAVDERAKRLFGKDGSQGQKSREKRGMQVDLFEILGSDSDFAIADQSRPEVGRTILDRVHQSMLLFAAGRTESLKRLLIEDGVGRDGRYWRLAQALSALYPSVSTEKRWIDGVLARKRGLGF